MSDTMCIAQLVYNLDLYLLTTYFKIHYNVIFIHILDIFCSAIYETMHQFGALLCSLSATYCLLFFLRLHESESVAFRIFASCK